MKEWTGKATTENIPLATEFINAQLEDLGCPLRIQAQIDLALDEILANISSYAYQRDRGEMTVRFAFDREEQTVTMVFEDEGMPFDPLAKADPDVSLPAMQRQIGGLGIFLVKKTMDEVTYRRENGRNILTVRKRL